MIRVRLRAGSANDSGHFYCYRLVGEDLASDFPLLNQNVFEKECPETPLQGDFRLPALRDGEGKALYSGKGWTGNQWREVDCYGAAWGYRIKISGIGVFTVSKDGQRIQYGERADGVHDDLIVEATLGPALILALAQRGKFCFHASAVSYEARQMAFLGESGRGKSTLARWLDERSGERWRRVADDILPVSMTRRDVVCLPHFPQLKISAQRQPALRLPEYLPLDTVYIVRRPASDGRVVVQPLNGKEALLALIRHTVSSRLFDAELLTRHLDFCKQVAEQIPVKELRYPLVSEALPAVETAIAADVDAL